VTSGGKKGRKVPRKKNLTRINHYKERNNATNISSGPTVYMDTAKAKRDRKGGKLAKERKRNLAWGGQNRHEWLLR